MHRKVILVCLLCFFCSYVKSKDDDVKLTSEQSTRMLEETEQRILKRKQIKQIEKTAKDAPAIENYKEQVKTRIIKNSVYRKNRLDHESSSQKRAASFIQTSRPISSSDNPFPFFNTNNYQRKINKLRTKGSVKVIPWSSSYWPLFLGALSVRYNVDSKNSIGIWNAQEKKFDRHFNWKESVNSYHQPQENNRIYYSRTFNEYVYNNYSAAEKYDLLVGDLSFSLTRSLKWYGGHFKDAEGNVAEWMGLCHGWAPASYKYKAPKRPVTLMAADNRSKVTFMPDDIKGLASAFWANAKYYTDFSGNVCSDCKSINPASLLMILSEHVGVNGKNLIFDPAADEEIWNQPINSYEITYYNLLDKKVKDSLNANKVRVSQLYNSNDEFLKRVYNSRSRYTYWVVGALFKIDYTFESPLRHSATSHKNVIYTAEYIAALEIDYYGNVLGGEWKHEEYPNFVWQPDDNSKPQGLYDHYMSSFDGSSSQLRGISHVAKYASRYRQVLRAIVDYLVDKSAE